MRLNTNLNSLNIYRNQRENLRTNSEALNRIVSGKKLLHAKDNPNKIGQSSTMQIKVRSLEMASRNIQDATSMTQAIEGSIASIGDSLIRMKELSVKAANDTNTTEDRITIQKEIESIKEGIDDIVNGSGFNGVFPIKDSNVNDNHTPDHITLLGGAEVGDTIKIKTYNLSTEFLKDKNGNSIKNVDVTTTENASKAISTIDDAMSLVNGIRSHYGAVQSRLESSTEYLSESVNLTERSVSHLSDADLAKEMLTYSRTSILTDASMGLMAQSNKLPKEVLSILERIK